MQRMKALVPVGDRTKPSSPAGDQESLPEASR